MKANSIIGSTAACLLALNSSIFAQAGHWKELWELAFPENYPTKETTARLHDEVRFQRACQVVTSSLPAMVFPNGSGRPANMLHPQDHGYFEGLAEFVQREYVGPEDWSMRGMMASPGIVKDEPFAPDANMEEILTAGADVGMKMAQATSRNSSNRHGHPPLFKAP